jgi:hypothetical protein
MKKFLTLFLVFLSAVVLGQGIDRVFSVANRNSKFNRLITVGTTILQKDSSIMYMAKNICGSNTTIQSAATNGWLVRVNANAQTLDGYGYLNFVDTATYEAYWDRTGDVLSPHTATDSVNPNVLVFGTPGFAIMSYIDGSNWMLMDNGEYESSIGMGSHSIVFNVYATLMDGNATLDSLSFYTVNGMNLGKSGALWDTTWTTHIMPQDTAYGIILPSANGTLFRITVSNTGVITATALP